MTRPGSTFSHSDAGRLGAHRVDAPALRAALHAGGDVNVVAHHRVAEPRVAAHVADDRGPVLSPMRAWSLWTISGHLSPSPLHFSRSSPIRFCGRAAPRRTPCERVAGERKRRAVDHDDGVADVLVERAALRLEDVRAGGQVLVHQLDEARRGRAPPTWSRTTGCR
jgi:hypothetical protein